MFDLNIYKSYDEMKSKQKKYHREMVFYTDMMEVLLSMFDYKNLPKTIPQDMLEMILIQNGECGIGHINGDLIATCGGRCGTVDAYGLGTEWKGATPNGELYGVIDDTVVVGWNNSMRLPDFDLLRFAKMFSDTDLSMEYNILYARYNPFIVASTKKQKVALETAMSNMQVGEMVTVLSENILEELEGHGSGIHTEQITDVRNIDKIQYLSQFHNDLEKRFYQKYGQSLQTTNKLAQTTTDEIHGMDSVSFIVPLDRLKHRQEMCDKINAMFGTDISVDFSPAWNIEYKKFKDSLEKSNDEIKDKSNDEIKDKSNDEIKDKSNDEIKDKSNDEIKDKSNDEKGDN